MGKVKEWAIDCAEEAMDKIIVEYNNGSISKEAAIAEILQIPNIDLLEIDEMSVQEVF